MYCPKCNAEYREGVRRCADCGVALVERLPEADERQSVDFEEILATYNPGDVAVVKSILVNAGIPYFFHGENFMHVRPLIEPARLMVPKDRVAEARSLLKDLKLSFRGINPPRGKDKEC